MVKESMTRWSQINGLTAGITSLILLALVSGLLLAVSRGGQFSEKGEAGSPKSVEVAALTGDTGDAGDDESEGRSVSLPVGLDRGDWSGIRTAHETAKYRVRSTDRGWQAWNPGQQWVTNFDGRGFVIRQAGPMVTHGNDWAWGLELKGYGFGNRQTLVRGKAREVSMTGHELRYRWGGRSGQGIEEWYLNDRNGFEHGFTIHERPAVGVDEGKLSLTLKVRGTLLAERAADGKSIAFRNREGGAVVNYSGLKVWDAKGKELKAQFQEVNPELVKITIDECEAIYPITVDPTAQQAYLKASNSESSDWFGSSVAIHGDTVVVGAINEDSDGINGDQSNALKPESGAAYVFVRNGTTWTQQAYLKASNCEHTDAFGSAVAVFGDTVVVSAVNEDGPTTGINGVDSNAGYDTGAVYVFVRNGTTWTQQAYIKASNTDDYDLFGYSLALSGETLVVGATQEDGGVAGVNGDDTDDSAADSGAAYVFVRNGATWTQQAYLKSGSVDAGDSFGYAVGVHDDTVVVGAVTEDSQARGVGGDQTDNTVTQSGAAYVFVRNGMTWSQQAYLKASNTETNDFFGWSVGVYGDRVVVGAIGEDSAATSINGNQSDNSATDAGAAYVFARTGTTWSQEAYLKAKNAEAGDGFGWSVAMSGDAIVVTAPYEGSSAKGVDGDSQNNGASTSGAAYLFVTSQSAWIQLSYLKASNTESGDYFGWWAAISMDTIVVAALNEASGAKGVNGNEADNSESGSGAVYAFRMESLKVTGNVQSVSTSIGAGGVATVTITVSNPGSIPQDGTLTLTIPAGLSLVPGSCVGAGGVCVLTPAIGQEGSLNATYGKSSATAALASILKWIGTVQGFSSVTISFQVQVGTQATTGTRYCIQTGLSGIPGSNLCLTVSVPQAGAGSLPQATTPSNGQKPGSVLIYNLYTSGVNPAANDTRITMTNTNTVNSVYVHMFFVDGANCSVADQYITLTQNQTVSLLASDIDPGVSGYVLAVATDAWGCPIPHNDLIGEAFVKYESGHRANLAAIGVSALAAQSCTSNTVTATLAFDGVIYNELPRVLAIDGLSSRAESNETMLVVNRLGGNLTTGASTVGTMAGLLFDDTESSASFTLPGGTCQTRGVLGNNFPRTAPRYEAMIPAGRAGWMKLWTLEDTAISGAVINKSNGRFNHGHNLHALTTTTTASLTIPVFPAR